ncbi:Biotin synthase [Hydrogenovibrio crunogenus]|uniref:Biotin synthase n=1 Tax=Hydrogenovibrio crunogenus TaxID=39765 RepID=A0A4P7P1H3_9GAMM|nr:biotin synthase BioB [Hydrogenovibrio crunogenus]QBZ84020.1 Biotin synthase [Hydrogenovibrio crunogenus]RUM92992.1 MAG: biotin synthase BioB [Thiomicrospira sp.]
MALGDVRNDWTLEEIKDIMNQPFNDLMFQAQTVHRQHFNPNEIQTSTLVNIKSGGCAEDCAYCSQSARNQTEVEKEQMMEVQEVIEQAMAAKEKGATRLCMGAAWRNPTKKDFPRVLEMVRVVKDLGLETCLTLGMLNDDQVKQLKEAGLDYYNHNLDTSEAFYPKIITTRSYQDRLETIDKVQEAGINVCSGGIIGMGEQHKDRAELIRTFGTMRHHPNSVPINLLVPVEGTPLAHMKDKTDSFEFIRVIATARIVMPQTYVRLSAGRMELTDEAQALCFLAGANSIFYGDKLLTTDNPEAGHDEQLFAKLGIQMQQNAKAEAAAKKLAEQTTELTA